MIAIAQRVSRAEVRVAAEMNVELVNDGPVTFVIEARVGVLAGR
jgi:D-Tyr-tRNAtyr deacylase